MGAMLMNGVLGWMLLFPAGSGAQGSPGGQQAAPPPPSASVPQQPAPAQTPPAPGAAQPVQGAPLGKLNLSDDQKKQIHTARRQAQQQVETVKNDPSLTPEQKREKIHQIRRDESAAIDNTLTPEQREKYDAYRRARHHHRRHPSQP
jgi:Spy/CpxP family protein refolding chaperone